MREMKKVSVSVVVGETERSCLHFYDVGKESFGSLRDRKRKEKRESSLKKRKLSLSLSFSFSFFLSFFFIIFIFFCLFLLSLFVFFLTKWEWVSEWVWRGFFFCFVFRWQIKSKALAMVEGLIGNKKYIILIIKLIFFFWGYFCFCFLCFYFCLLWSAGWANTALLLLHWLLLGVWCVAQSEWVRTVVRRAVIGFVSYK